MDDAEFVQRMKQRIESAAGMTIELVIDEADKRRIEVDVTAAVPRVVFGSDTLAHAGLARMFSQFAILCLKEQRQVSEEEFIRYLRRN
ncbi:MAG: hypothetical protein EXR49_06270 [Dehalococcoidia bacterium]|nr:hypothetical protein [Dehalococcoidia bacterium]